MKTLSARPDRTGNALLDLVQTRLEGDRVEEGMHCLYRGLAALRDQMGADEWQRFARETVPAHPVLQIVHEDPVCRHSFERPRGYPGDAELIDFVYGVRQPDVLTRRGHILHSWNLGRGPMRGVRHRREFLAHVLDREAQRNEGRLRALSVACGHLREATLSSALRCGWVDELVALDSDAVSLAEAAAVDPERVKPVHLSVARLPRRGAGLGEFDLIYSAGLYDYLDEAFARSLTAALFEMLKPGGALVLGNFQPGVADSAFMETFMDWRLIYRDREELAALAADIPASELASLEHCEDPYGVFGYVELRRSADRSAKRRAGGTTQASHPAGSGASASR